MKEDKIMTDTNNNNLTRQMHDSVVPVTGNDMAGIQASAMAQELMRKAVDNIQNTAPKYKVETPLVKPDTSQDGRYKLNVDTSFGAGIDLLKSSGLRSDPRQRADKSKMELDSILKKIRSDASKTYYGNQQSNAPVWMKNQAEQTDYGTFGAPVKVNASQIYDTLKDNDTLLAKYPSYTPGMNNEEIAIFPHDTESTDPAENPFAVLRKADPSEYNMKGQVRTVVHDGHPAYLFRMSSRDVNAAYTFIDFTVSADNCLPVSVTYESRNGDRYRLEILAVRERQHVSKDFFVPPADLLDDPDVLVTDIKAGLYFLRISSSASSESSPSLGGKTSNEITGLIFDLL